jgi:hypothetical protein
MSNAERQDLVLTTGADPRGRGILAIITQGGHPQLDRERVCEVLTLEIFKTRKEARRWFEQMRVERPWIKRS